MGSDVLLPPAPNWYCHHTFHCRQEDSLLATACFRSIVIYEIGLEQKLPKLLKVIANRDGKVIGVCLFHNAQNPMYGYTMAAITDELKVLLINIQSGEVMKSHQEHKAAISGITWGELCGESVIVSIGGNGQMAVWDPNELIPQVHILSYHNDFNFVEVLPHQRDQVIIGSEKLLLLVSLKDGGVLHQFKGHDQEVYTIAWYPGTGCPLEDAAGGSKDSGVAQDGQEQQNDICDSSDSTNWRESKSFSGDPGPFFATSDLSRNVFIWSFSAKRYIFKINVPYSTSSNFKKSSGSKGGRQHIALAWYNNSLISSSIQGELISWKLEPKGASLETLHHIHNRVIFNVAVINNVAVTSSQDRFIIGFRLDNSSLIFQIPALGSSCNTMQICPQDVTRLAIGLHENCIRVLNFGSQVPLGSKLFYLNIKGKVLSLSWHPEKEGLLLFGTSGGQVGVIDVNSGKVSQFAYFHQRSTYKVEWAPPLCSSDEVTELCAYSFGDRHIVMRSPSNLDADPVFIKTLTPDSMKDKFLKDITEFSFSYDYKFLAIGSQDGQIQVYKTQTMSLLVTYNTVMRKPIQHILWKPPVTTDSPYIFVVGSNEYKICVFHLEDIINVGREEQIVTQANQELHGHSGRVLWFSWSPHNDGMLASASYDRTIKIWDTESGRKLGTYSGHSTRILRVEFSLSDPNTLFSFSDDNIFHMWQLSKLDENSPIKKKEVPRKKPAKPKVEEEKSVENTIPIKQVRTKPVRQAQQKIDGSLFPAYHKAVSKKKSFHHLAILSMANWHHSNKQVEQVTNNEGETLDDELNDNLDEVPKSTYISEVTQSAVVDDCLEKYNFLQSEGAPASDRDDLLHMMNFHGQPQHINDVIRKEIDIFEAKENHHQASVLHLWNGSIEEKIRSAAKTKTLTPFLVSLAPQVSFQLWESTCDAYAQQLIDEGEIPAAASYYLTINKVTEAVSLLIKHKYHKEAVVVAKSRGSYDADLLKKAISSWASYAVLEGNFESTSFLNTSKGDIDEAARILSRRTDPGSIITAAELYKLQGNDEMANINNLTALKEASIKNDFQTIVPCIALNPQLQWYLTIHICHSELLQMLEKSKKSTDFQHLYTLPKKCDNCLKEFSKTMKYESQKNKENCSTSSNDCCTNTNKQGFITHLKDIWNACGIFPFDYKEIYSKIVNQFSTRQLPNSVKHLWFMVSVSMSKLLLTESSEDKEEFLDELLGYVLSWGRPDQMYHLTHILLPFGISDFTSLMPSEDTEGLKMKLKQVYCLSEISVYSEILNSKGTICPWNHSAAHVTKLVENLKISPSNNGDSEAELDSSGEAVKSITNDNLTLSPESTNASESQLPNVKKSSSGLINGNELDIQPLNGIDSSQKSASTNESSFLSWCCEEILIEDLKEYNELLNSVDESLLSTIKSSYLSVSNPTSFLSEFIDKLVNFGALSKNVLKTSS